MQNYCGESAAVTSLFLLPRIINSHHHGCCVDYEYTKYLHCSSVLFVECSFVVCVTVLCKKLRPKEVQPVVGVENDKENSKDDDAVPLDPEDDFSLSRLLQLQHVIIPRRRLVPSLVTHTAKRVRRRLSHHLRVTKRTLITRKIIPSILQT